MSSASIGDDAKTMLPLEGMVAEWESSATLREHLRQADATLFPPSIGENVKSASHPHVVALLTPMLVRTAKTPGMPQPGIDPLKDEVSKLYQTCSKLVDPAVVIHDAWMMRKLLSFVKMKTRTEKVSTAAWLILGKLWHDAGGVCWGLFLMLLLRSMLKLFYKAIAESTI